MTNEVATRNESQKSLVVAYASKMGVAPEKLLNTLKHTAFKQKSGEVSDEQMMALLVVANKYDLNPFVKEIYAYPDKQGIVPIVGVDGWSRMINNHPQFDGLEFEYSDTVAQGKDHKPCPEWVKCRIYRKDRQRPVEVTEFFDEVYRPPFEGEGRNGKYKVAGPWQSHTKRMLRHKALIQCARLAFGYTGIFDEDEADRILEQRQREAVVVHTSRDTAENLTAALQHKQDETVTVSISESEPDDEPIEGTVEAAEEPAPEPPKEAAEEPDEQPLVDKILAKMNKASAMDELDAAADLMNDSRVTAAQKKVLRQTYEVRKFEMTGDSE